MRILLVIEGKLTHTTLAEIQEIVDMFHSTYQEREIYLRIYPNPSLGEFYINKPVSVEIESIKIYSVLGKLIKKQSFSDTIDISELTSGLYYIYFETNYGKIHKTLLKQ